MDNRERELSALRGDNCALRERIGDLVREIGELRRVAAGAPGAPKVPAVVCLLVHAALNGTGMVMLTEEQIAEAQSFLTAHAPANIETLCGLDAWLASLTTGEESAS